MPQYNPKETEPAGKSSCSKCSTTAYLWSDEYNKGEYIKPLCVNCLMDEDSAYPQVLLQEATDYRIIDGAVILDFEYDLEVEFPFDKNRVAASRNPNETKTVIQPSVDKTGDVYYMGDKIGTFTSKSWRDYAEEKVRDYYIERR